MKDSLYHKAIFFIFAKHGSYGGTVTPAFQNTLQVDKVKKIIGIPGTCQSDICMYLSSVMTNLGISVIICDLSEDGRMISCIPKPAANLDVVSYRGVDFCEGFPMHTDREYNCEIWVMDENPSQELLKACDEIYMVSGCEKHQIENARGYMMTSHLPMNVVIRNVCPGSINSKAFFGRIEEENAFVLEEYSLPIDPIDEGYRIKMQYGSFDEFKELSKAFSKMITRMATQITEISHFEVHKAFTLARKGVMLCA